MKRLILISLIGLTVLLAACQSTSPSPSITIEISSTSPATTDSNIEIAVNLTGDTADTVKLQLNNQDLTTLKGSSALRVTAENFTYTWDVSGETNGSYSFKAVATVGDQTFTSNELNFTLEKAPTPNPNPTPEPNPTPNPEPTPAPTPTTAPDSFEQLGEDRALGTGAQDLGERPISLAGDASGNAVLAYNDKGTIKVAVQAGSLTLADLPVDAESKVDSMPVVALLSTGNPVVAWRNGADDAGTADVVEASNIEVYRWTGSAWEDLGPVGSSLEASAPDMVIGSDDSIYLTYHASDGTNPDIVVYKYASSSWSQLGTVLDSDGGAAIAISPAITLGASDKPIVSWTEELSEDAWTAEQDNNSSTADNKQRTIYAKEFDGSAWTSVGGILNQKAGSRADMVRLATDIDGNPVLAWHEKGLNAADALDDRIFVQKWTGSAWALLGDAIDRTDPAGAQYPDVAVDNTGVITVSWNEALTGETPTDENESVLLSQWRDDKWTEIAKLDDDSEGVRQSYFPTVSILNEAQTPIVSWIQYVAGEAEILTDQGEIQAAP